MKADRLVTFIATGAYSGLSPIAPGTAGSLVGVLLHLVCFAYLPLWLAGLGIAVLFAVGVAAAARYDHLKGTKDNGAIVIDEVVGQLIAAIPCGSSLALTLGSFVLFRVFDVLKPSPARQIDRRMKTGLGIMLDDVVAGGYALAIMFALIRFAAL